MIKVYNKLYSLFKFNYNWRHCSAISLTVVMLCVCIKRVCVRNTELVCKAVRLAFSCQTSAISFPFIPIRWSWPAPPEILYTWLHVGEEAEFVLPQYVGETGGRRLIKGWGGHRGTITQLGQENTQAPVGVHIRAPGHFYADVFFIPIEKIRSRNSMARKVKESSRYSTQWDQDRTRKHNANCNL